MLVCRFVTATFSNNKHIKNLAHTPSLRDYLLSLTSEQQGEGPLTAALRLFMLKIWKEAGTRLNPSFLFSEICKK